MSNQLNFSTLSFSHGQVIQTIEAMHIAEWLDRTALDSILKKLRRDKVPFTAEELDKPRWEHVRYGYIHLVECVIAIIMMRDGIAHRHIVELLTVDRPKLREAYKKAFTDANKGLGKPIPLKHPDGREIHISGLYLDFMARVTPLGVLTTTGPRLLDPWQALSRYMGLNAGFHPLLPIRLTDLATEAVRVATLMPELKRGRKQSGN